ncbi:glyceraldehyde 3-phosphate dehydrogenase NAD-binding domain-containing protein [Desulforhopalus singaporensis]|uniref:Erythrose 4-phosphate dehydrogenase n=1 Tax=Desulforhopalus singaporensis TaxID=91360 RepID=A0A1H0NYG1_9BACT|nr:glyceraldehyde 3-phosphate dehydrogenase NAD-binding domain-containing protein [Desulforhopalus singaporensis]SDO97807.1 erythrose 4-phosphate dehydrogenase [Desulforhopalus singaporensis]
MSYKVAINGYGRIGQSVLRAVYSSPYRSEFSIIAINELADIETLTYLTRYDTTHGRFPYPLRFEGNTLYIGDDRVKIISEKDPAKLPWKELGIDLLFECSGTFDDRGTADIHVASGARKILVSHPMSSEVDATIVYGFNEKELLPHHTVVSNASCTTNCIVPILNILDREYGIECGTTTTIHSAMNDQPVIDSYHHTNLRLTRSALHSIIPVDTGLAKGINRLLPHLTGRFECLHVRVPTINVSAMDLSINLKRPTSAGALNQLLQHECENDLHGLAGFTEEPHASVDFNTDPRSCVIDGTQTKVCCDRLVKLFCWFDNEWGFASRMLDVANRWLKL